MQQSLAGKRVLLADGTAYCYLIYGSYLGSHQQTVGLLKRQHLLSQEILRAARFAFHPPFSAALARSNSHHYCFIV